MRVRFAPWAWAGKCNVHLCEARGWKGDRPASPDQPQQEKLCRPYDPEMRQLGFRVEVLGGEPPKCGERRFVISINASATWDDLELAQYIERAIKEHAAERGRGKGEQRRQHDWVSQGMWTPEVYMVSCRAL